MLYFCEDKIGTDSLYSSFTFIRNYLHEIQTKRSESQWWCFPPRELISTANMKDRRKDGWLLIADWMSFKGDIDWFLLLPSMIMVVNGWWQVLGMSVGWLLLPSVVFNWICSFRRIRSESDVICDSGREYLALKSTLHPHAFTLPGSMVVFIFLNSVWTSNESEMSCLIVVLSPYSFPSHLANFQFTG